MVFFFSECHYINCMNQTLFGLLLSVPPGMHKRDWQMGSVPSFSWHERAQLIGDAHTKANKKVLWHVVGEWTWSQNFPCQTRRDYVVLQKRPFFVKVNQDGLWGMTALHMAARYNDLRMLKTCLDFQAELYPCDHEGRKPIHQAANTGSMDTLKVSPRRCWGCMASINLPWDNFLLPIPIKKKIPFAHMCDSRSFETASKSHVSDTTSIQAKFAFQNVGWISIFSSCMKDVHPKM